MEENRLNIPTARKALSKRAVIILIAAAVLLAALAAVVIMLLNGSAAELTKAQEPYRYNYNVLSAKDELVDADMKVDGKLDEEIWSQVNFTSHTEYGLNYKVGTYFSDTGIYIALTAEDQTVQLEDGEDFSANGNFEVFLARTDVSNDPYGGNIESAAYMPTEVIFIEANSAYVKVTPTIPVYKVGTSSETDTVCEIFVAWEDLGLQEKPEQMRIWSLYRRENPIGNESTYVYNGGFYSSNRCVYPMFLFDEMGSISQSGTVKNTADNTLGNSPLGQGATDRWDLSGDTASGEVRTAQSNASFHQAIYLKDQSAYNFEFETTLTIDADSETLERKAGIQIVSSNPNDRRLFVTYPGVSSFRLGTLIHGMYWINTGGDIATGTGSTDNTVCLKVAKYGDSLYYFYRYAEETQWTFAYCEAYSLLEGDECAVGLYASSNVTFSDWKFTSYDDTPETLREQLSEYAYFAEAQIAEGEGEVTLSESAVIKGQPLTVTAIPNRGYFLEKIEINGKDETAAFIANALEGTYTFVPTEDVDIQVTFTAFSEEEAEQLQRTYIVITRGDNQVVSGANVMVYPVSINGDGYILNSQSAIYMYRATTSSAGYATFELPYAGSALYEAGTYLVKINNDEYFCYETVVVIEHNADGIPEIAINIPSEMIIQGNTGTQWSVSDDGTVTVVPNPTGDKHSLAYFSDPLLCGEISAEFTTSQKGGIFAGFGYRIFSGSNVGSVGLIGVQYTGSSLRAVTYNYYGSYGGVDVALPYDSLVAGGDIKKNADGSVTFKLRLIRGEREWYLYVGDTYVYTYAYGSGIQIDANTEVQLGLMFRASYTHSKTADLTYTIRDIQKTTIWSADERQAVISGSVSGDSRDNMTVRIKGTNVYGAQIDSEISVPVKNDGTYSLSIGDLGETPSNYILEFYQGTNVLRSQNGKPITFSLKAQQAVAYDVVFNEFKKEYDIVMNLEGLDAPVTKSDVAIIGTKAELPEVYTYGGAMYVLDKSAQGSTVSGTVPADGKLVLTGYYKLGFAYSTNSRFTAGSDQNGLTLTSPATSTEKYILSKEAGNAFEITATFSGVSGGTELGSGFLVSDGKNHLTFMWMSWSGGLQVRDHWSSLKNHVNIGALPSAYDSGSNSSVRLKMVYNSRTFRFYLVEGSRETLVSTFALDQHSKFDTAGWTSDTQLKVGFFSWGNSVSAVEVSDIQITWPEVLGYTKEIYLPSGELLDSQYLTAEVGSQVTIKGVYDHDGDLYIMDGTCPGDVASGTLTDEEYVVISGTLNNKVFSYGTYTNNLLFDVSANNNLTMKFSGGAQTYIYSKYKGSQFTIKAKFTSTSENCETGFSVMNGSGQKLTFRLVGWSDKIAVLPDYDWSRTTYIDLGIGKVEKNRTVVLTMTYDHGTFTFDYNGNKTTYTNEYFEDDLYAGFLSYHDSSTGSIVELLSCQFTYPKDQQKEELLEGNN